MIERIADGRTDLVLDLIEQGVPLDIVDGQGTSLIQWCAYYGDVLAIRLMLSQGASLDWLGPNYDLNGAVYHGHWQLCQFLIEKGADVNFPLPDTGETPLHAALCKAGQPAYIHVLRLLLARGADPRVATSPNVPTGGFMRDCRTKGETPLHRAAAFGTPEMIRVLLDAGAVVDALDQNGESPLSWASWHLRPASVLQLLCYGPHRISEAHVAHYTGDHGQGHGGLEASLQGKPHL